MRGAGSFWMGAMVLASTALGGCTLLIDSRIDDLRDGGSDGGTSPDAGPRDSGVDAFVPPVCDGVSCDANAHCEDVAGTGTCVCDGGFVDDAGACVDVNECADGSLTCDAAAVCRNTPGSASCFCMPGTSGDGTTCTPAAVLVWTDGTSRAALEMAIAAAGFGAQIFESDDAGFEAAFDAGGFDAVVLSTSTNATGAGVNTRVRTWAEGGGNLVLAVYDLDGTPDLAAAGDISVTMTLDTPRPIHPAANALPNLFDQQGSLTSPIAWASGVGDDGDLLAPLGPALVLARFDTPSGPPATVVTRGGHTIVNGFVANGITSDADSDGIDDFGELVQNELNFLLRPRALVYLDDFEARPTLPAAMRQLGWTRLEVRVPTAFPAAYDAGGFELVVIQSGSNSLEDPFQTRLFDWIGSDGRAIFSYWDLDGSDRPTTVFRSALEVSTVTRDMAQPIFLDPAPSIDLFHVREDVPVMITPTGDLTDNGDELTPTAADGVIIAHFDAADGPGALAVTREGRVIVHGFLPVDFTNADDDGDSIPDIQELYVNELLFLFAR